MLTEEDLHVLLDSGGVLLDVQGVASSLRKLRTSVHGEGGRDGSEHKNSAPDIVTILRALLEEAEAGRDGDHGSVGDDETNTLHGEHGSDEGSTVLLGSVLGHDDSGQRIVTTDAETKDEAEEKEGSHDSNAGATEGETLHEGEGNHDGEGDAVDSLAADLITEVAEEDLTAESTDQGNGRGSGVDGERKAALIVDPTNELCHHANDLEIVCIGEETHTSDDDGLDVEPRELGIVEGVEDSEAGLEMISHGGDDSGRTFVDD